MAKLGSHKRPAVVRVNNFARAEEIVHYCDAHGWKVIAGVEPDKPEDVSDFEKLVQGARVSSPQTSPEPRIGRNEPCPCGSGKKYKKCCSPGNSKVTGSRE